MPTDDSQATTGSTGQVSVEVGCKHDVPDLVALARDQLPTMTHLHDLQSWSDFYRFGAGQHPQDNFFIVVRTELPDGSEPLMGFCWVDQSMRIDYGIDQPWWCINAVAVAESSQRRGLGRSLVTMIREKAAEVGVVSIYGLSHPSGFGFWEAQAGFALTPQGASLRSSSPVLTAAGSSQVVSLQPEPEHRFFYASTVAAHETSVVLGPGDE